MTFAPALGALTLKTKTRLIFGVLLACLVGIGAFSVTRLSQVSQQSDLIASVWTRRLATADQIHGAAREYRISEAVRILSVSPEMAQQADDDLTANAEQMAAEIATFRKQLRPGDSKAAIDEVDRLWSDYVAANQDMLDYARNGQATEAADRFRNSASKFYLVADALSRLVDEAKTRSDQANATAAAISSRSRIELIAGLLALAAMTLAATLFFEFKVWRVLVQMSGVMQRLAKGDFEAEVVGAARRDEVGEMARAVQVFRDNGLEVRRLESETDALQTASQEERAETDRRLAREAAERAFVVEQIAACLARLSKGDLTVRQRDEFPPEFKKLRDDFNAAMDDLESAMQLIAARSDGIHAGTQEISQASDMLARRTEQQAASLEEAAAALEQLTDTVRTSAENAKVARVAVADAKSSAEQSGDVVSNAVAAMSEIERSAQQISEIIGVMDEIAFQTNLLALNAGVEAARAGEAGRGFAVVATEVRALAQRSTVAAKEIKTLISASTRQVGAGVSLVGETGEALRQIVAQVGDINTAISGIAAAAEEQADSLLQINTTVSQMDKVTQQNAAMAEESTAASHSLGREADELTRLISRFHIERAAALRAPAAAAAPAPRPAQHGRAILGALSSGNAALAEKLESALVEEGWEEF
ncbi:MAG: HAMP domain-containing methyl-accepting chemotaxis protein [Pseudomonadota bacterium]